jgi:single-stranded-DNA-specific exonuclease
MTEKISQIPPIFLDYLKARGIAGEEAAYKFLYPNLADLPRPELMLNLAAAARLVVEYITAKKQIIIWGDYDVDGTTGTALLVNFFRELETEVRWHIPNRMREGYGLHSTWFTDQSMTSLGDDFLLITVDCGISNAEQIEIIKRRGGKVIITDHHRLPEQSIPDCLILNPSQPLCGFNAEHLAGVGVAFYLAAGVRAEISANSACSGLVSVVRQLNLKKYLTFVALGTVADVVPVTPTNRILVRAGLESLAQAPFVGLHELLISCEVTGKHITSEDIGYLIGPKINAAGRLGESQVVVDLLTSRDRKKSKRLAQRLTALNIERKKISDDNLETALTNLSIAHLERFKCVIVRGNLHQGVAGIVASRLVEKFKVPSIVFAKSEQPDGKELYTGSARSVEGVNIVAVLTDCSQWIERFGGHEMAAGCTVAENNFTDFSKRFSALVLQKMEEVQVKVKKSYDIRCSPELIMEKDHLNCLRLLEPFGPGNPQPVFHDPAVTILDARAVGRDSEHLQVTIRGRYANIKGIGFSLGSQLEDVQRQPKRNMVYTPTMNRFRGNVNWQVRVIDI